MKALIIEDEPNSKLLLQKFIQNYCKNISVIGFSETIKDAIYLIESKKPDIIFLDIELKDGNGLELLHHFENPKFVTIIITGYNQYAIEAIKKNTLDYLLKPIVIKELITAVEKAKKRHKEIQILHQITKSNTIEKTNTNKIVLSTLAGKITIINLEDLMYIQAQNQYTKWVSKSSKKIDVVRCSLKKSTELLPNNFIQIHRSYIINLNLVTSLDKGRAGFVEINSTKIPIAARRKKDLFNKIK